MGCRVLGVSALGPYALGWRMVFRAHQVTKLWSVYSVSGAVAAQDAASPHGFFLIAKGMSRKTHPTPYSSGKRGGYPKRRNNRRQRQQQAGILGPSSEGKSPKACKLKAMAPHCLYTCTFEVLQGLEFRTLKDS